MTDNVEINAMAGGATIAADDIDGVKHQRVKVGFGADGMFSDVYADSPLPTSLLGGAAVGSAQAEVPVPGISVQLADRPGIYGLTVRAELGNTGTVYVGGPDVSTATGFELAPGDAASFDVANSSAVYIDADSAGDGVRLLWVSA